MRILVLGINYAPERTGIAPYTRALAEHLARDHQVTVVTGMPHYPEWRVPPEFHRWRIDRYEGSVRVIRLRHYVPKSQNTMRRLAFELTWATRAIAASARTDPEVVIAIVPPLLAAPAARLVARVKRVPYGVLVQDVVGSAAAQSGVAGGRLTQYLVRKTERYGLSAAAGIATIHARLALELKQIGRRQQSPAVIYNWTHHRQPSRASVPARSKYGWNDHDIVVLHTGNMGLKQNLEVVVEAARLAERQNPNVHFVLAGDGSQRRTLQVAAAACANISFAESVPDHEYLDLLASADVLLVNERPGMREMSLPSKLSSYLVAGVPIVVATDVQSTTADFVRDTGGGLIVSAGNPQDILGAVLEVVEDAHLAAKLTSNGAEFARLHLSEELALAAYDDWVLGISKGSSAH